jgi:hypothetical protein
MPSDCGIGAGVIACAEVATAQAKPATAINLTIHLLPFYRGFLTSLWVLQTVGYAQDQGQRIVLLLC